MADELNDNQGQINIVNDSSTIKADHYEGSKYEISGSNVEHKVTGGLGETNSRYNLCSIKT